VPISTGEVFSTKTATLQIALDASVSNFRRVRRPDDSLSAALAEAKVRTRNRADFSLL
jgi:hypothetical protein